MGARRGGGVTGEGSRLPLEKQIILLFVGPFCYVFSMWGAFFVHDLLPPLTKISEAPMNGIYGRYMVWYMYILRTS